MGWCIDIQITSRVVMCICRCVWCSTRLMQHMYVRYSIIGSSTEWMNEGMEWHGMWMGMAYDHEIERERERERERDRKRGVLRIVTMNYHWSSPSSFFMLFIPNKQNPTHTHTGTRRERARERGNWRWVLLPCRLSLLLLSINLSSWEINRSVRLASSPDSCTTSLTTLTKYLFLIHFPQSICSVLLFHHCS